jgi:hypothetical protein
LREFLFFSFFFSSLSSGLVGPLSLSQIVDSSTFSHFNFLSSPPQADVAKFIKLIQVSTEFTTKTNSHLLLYFSQGETSLLLQDDSTHEEATKVINWT